MVFGWSMVDTSWDAPLKVPMAAPTAPNLPNVTLVTWDPWTWWLMPILRVWCPGYNTSGAFWRGLLGATTHPVTS